MILLVQQPGDPEQETQGVTGDRPATNSGVRSDSLGCRTHDAGARPAPAPEKET